MDEHCILLDPPITFGHQHSYTTQAPPQHFSVSKFFLLNSHGQLLEVKQSISLLFLVQQYVKYLYFVVSWVKLAM